MPNVTPAVHNREMQSVAIGIKILMRKSMACPSGLIQLMMDPPIHMANARPNAAKKTFSVIVIKWLPKSDIETKGSFCAPLEVI